MIGTEVTADIGEICLAGMLVPVPDRYAAVYEGYEADLAGSELDARTRRVYASRVRSFLAWLAGGEHNPDPLEDFRGRNAALAAYRDWLEAEGRTRSTVNAHLTALSSFYVYLGLGPVPLKRDRVPRGAPRVLSPPEQRAYLNAVAERPLARDRAIGYLLFWTGVQLEELAALDTTDVPVTRGRTSVIVRDPEGAVLREIPLVDPAARESVEQLTAERAEVPGADGTSALFLNRSGGRLSGRSVALIVQSLAAAAELVHSDGTPAVSAQVLRQTFSAELVAAGVGPAFVTALLGSRPVADMPPPAPGELEAAFARFLRRRAVRPGRRSRAVPPTVPRSLPVS